MSKPEPYDPHAVGFVHCINCGHRWVAVVPVDPVEFRRRDHVLDMLECSQCGKFTGCSE